MKSHRRALHLNVFDSKHVSRSIAFIEDAKHFHIVEFHATHKAMKSYEILWQKFFILLVMSTVSSWARNVQFGRCKFFVLQILLMMSCFFFFMHFSCEKIQKRNLITFEWRKSAIVSDGFEINFVVVCCSRNGVVCQRSISSSSFIFDERENVSIEIGSSTALEEENSFFEWFFTCDSTQNANES